MAPKQLELPYLVRTQVRPVPTQERLAALLYEDLDFHERDSGYASHNFHSFPAKFPPQLPRKFKSGGVSVACDLPHTRPHRANPVVNKQSGSPSKACQEAF